MTGRREITSVDELAELLGSPDARALNKGRDHLLEVDRRWLAASSFCVVATSDAEGRCDASPKGDPAGSLVRVIDDRTIALGERPGNRRADGYRNIFVARSARAEPAYGAPRHVFETGSGRGAA